MSKRPVELPIKIMFLIKERVICFGYTMKTMVILIVCIMMIGCAHSPMQFQLAPGTNQSNYQTALKECGGDTTSGGYFLFGPLIILAPVVAIVEGVKYNQRGGIKNCMEAKGFKCVANCPDSSFDKPSENPQKNQSQ